MESSDKNLQSINILMFGPTAVGKTSLLTSMYICLDKLVDEGGLNLVPDGSSGRILDQTSKEIIEIFKKDELLVKTGINATEAIREFKFFLSSAKEKKPFLAINFIDVPGEWIGINAKDDHIKRIESLVITSDILLIAIDTPAMIENDGVYMNDINNPDTINKDLMRIIKADKKKLIIFCPVKCEKYLNSNEQNNLSINTKIKSHYEKLLNYLSKNLSSSVCVAITPVQTLGGIRFQRIIENEIENELPSFIFVKKTPNSTYSPQDCEQPLRYALSFILSEHLKKEGFFPWLFGWNNFVRDALRKFSEGRKQNNPFEVIQGNSLLYEK